MARYRGRILAGSLRLLCVGLLLLLWLPSAPLAQTITTFAGGGVGDGGPAADAYVHRPAGGAFDAAGNFYFADSLGHRVKRVGSNGVITTIAGTGVAGFSGDGGQATSAQLNTPQDVAVDAAGNVFIADLLNYRLRKITPAGVITTLAGDGSSDFRDNVPGTTAGFGGISALAVDSAGNIHIADGSHQRIRKVSPGGFLTTVAGNGIAADTGDGGPAIGASFAAASDIAFDAAGNLYIADPFHSKIRRVDAAGIISTVAGGGASDAEGLPPLQTALGSPTSLGFGADGALYIGEKFKYRVRRLANGAVVTVVGNGSSSTGGDGGPALQAGLGAVEALSVAPDGRIAISAKDDAVRIATVGGNIQRYAGGGVGDGPDATRAYVSEPRFLATDAAGNVFLSTYGRIRRATPGGAIHTFAGTGQAGYSGDGGPAVDAQIGDLTGMAVGGAGELFIADKNIGGIRRIAPNGVISTIAEIPGLVGLARDPAGNLYTISGHRIFRVSPSGVQTVFAGTLTPGFSGDGGPASQASFHDPSTLLFSQGSLYVSDSSNFRLRKIAAGGIVTTVAGNGGAPYAGPGNATQIPLGRVVAMDDDTQGNLYLVLADAQRVHKLTAAGEVQEFAGDGTYGYFGDGGPAAGARFRHVNDVAVATQGNGTVYIADEDNDRIRKVTLGAVAAVPGAPDAPLAIAGDGKVVLAFDPPASSGSGPITGYVVTATPAAGIDADAGSLSRRRVVTGLQNGTSYRFSVRALNSTGPGLPSALSAPVVPSAAGTLPVLSVSSASADEGGDAVFVVRLDRVATTDVYFGFRTENGTAVAGSDYVARNLSGQRIRTGQKSVAVPVALLADAGTESVETFGVVLHSVTNATLGTDQAVGTIRNNDNPPPPAFGARDDRYELPENSANVLLDVLSNDHFTAARLAGGRVTITEPAQQGTVSVFSSGTAGTAADDYVSYFPRPDFSGEDVFAYEVCEPGGRCVEAFATVVLRPVPRKVVSSAYASGHETSAIGGLGALTSLEFQATPLAVPNVWPHQPLPDATPAAVWDAGLAGTSHVVHAIPAPEDGLPRKFQILVEASTSEIAEVDLYAGVDSNGDGLPSASELRCSSAQAGTAVESCDFGLQHPGTGVVRYWVMLHNIDHDPRGVNTHAFSVPLVPTDGTLAATGPGALKRLEPGVVRWFWDEPGAFDTLRRRGFIRVIANGVEKGRFPVGFDRVGKASAAKALQSGVTHRLRLAASEAQERLYIDVPAGSSLLSVTATTTGDLGLYLARGTADAGPGIALAPARGAASSSLPMFTGTQVLEVGGSQLSPGRWYVTPVNASDTGAAVATVTATVTGAAPVVRPGSYFNAARSGHGLFLYPAGGDWAGLWYTYLEDGTPTWYYLQGPAPGTNGLWTGILYRSSWTGSSNRLTAVGHGTVSPTAADAFRFSFSVDGETGSEPMTALGRGCPTVAGFQADSSSHWFDPAHSGTGYSVQLMPGYEFYAAFVYDAQGIARFLLAERPTVGGANAVLTLQQMTGFCPTCQRTDVPTRVDVGTFSRGYAAGALRSIGISGVYQGGVPGSWNAQDLVQTLGGAGTTQGCQP